MSTGVRAAMQRIHGYRGGILTKGATVQSRLSALKPLAARRPEQPVRLLRAWTVANTPVARHVTHRLSVESTAHLRARCPWGRRSEWNVTRCPRVRRVSGARDPLDTIDVHRRSVGHPAGGRPLCAALLSSGAGTGSATHAFSAESGPRRGHVTTAVICTENRIRPANTRSIATGALYATLQGTAMR